LSTAHTVELFYTEHRGRGQDFRTRPRRPHANVFDSRDLCWDDGHQQRGNQRESAAGNVAADGIKRPNHLAERYSVARFCPCFRLLQFAESANIFFSHTQCASELCGSTFPCDFHLGIRDSQRLVRWKAVELTRISQ